MPSLSVLYETTALMTGNIQDVSIRTRNCRERGLLGRSSKDRDAPQVESVHGVIVLLAMAASAVQTDAAEAVVRYWGLRGHLWFGHHRGDDGRTVYHPTQLAEGERLLGWDLLSLIEMAADPDPEKRGEASRHVGNVAVWRGWLGASIRCGGVTMIYDGRHSIPEGMPRSVKPLISTTTTVPYQAIQRVGDLVRLSRAEAERRGVTIPVDEAFAALGLETPPGPPSAAREPSKFLLPRSMDDTTGEPESKKAAGAPPPAALLADQPAGELAGEQDAQVSTEHPTEGIRSTQSSSVRQDDRSHQSPERAATRPPDDRTDKNRDRGRTSRARRAAA